ncbi:sporulation protein YtxC [Pseudogracilibacillus sp. SE30717A]|uniref:sporulation protein YtxC n=1 Tax=Pseudogracilibacillus sp. SE30717A TaxID=3098293 RepID=UPI00300DE352
MKVIYFRNEKEVIYFCEKLYQLQDEIHIQWKKDPYWGNELRIQDDRVSMDTVISCLVEVFTYVHLNKILKQIAREKYHYSDQEEIERICHLTNWIIFEKHYQVKLFEEEIHYGDYLYSILKQNVEQNYPIHFDSLITFSAQPFHEKLKEAVGYGIDELKREEEHQNFIQSIRDFTKRQQSKSKELHIIQGKNFSFYKSNGDQYSRFELKTLLHNEPLYILGLDKNEMNLSPVIALMPEKIFIYGDHPAEAKTLALINIFQERVTFFPKEQFPFRSHVN